MKRRKFVTTVATFAGSVAVARGGQAAMAGDSAGKSETKGLPAEKAKLSPPASGSIPVAILISEHLNVIDFSGPWGVFESVSLPDATEPPFHLFTVSEKEDVVISGSGLKL